MIAFFVICFSSKSIDNIQLKNHRTRSHSESEVRHLRRWLFSPWRRLNRKPPISPVKQIVRIVPDIGDVHLFCKTHLELIHENVVKVLKNEKTLNTKCDFCNPESGRYTIHGRTQSQKQFMTARFRKWFVQQYHSTVQCRRCWNSSKKSRTRMRTSTPTSGEKRSNDCIYRIGCGLDWKSESDWLPPIICKHSRKNHQLLRLCMSPPSHPLILFYSESIHIIRYLNRFEYDVWKHVSKLVLL